MSLRRLIGSFRNFQFYGEVVIDSAFGVFVSWGRCPFSGVLRNHLLLCAVPVGDSHRLQLSRVFLLCFFHKQSQST